MYKKMLESFDFTSWIMPCTTYGIDYIQQKLNYSGLAQSKLIQSPLLVLLIKWFNVFKAIFKVISLFYTFSNENIILNKSIVNLESTKSTYKVKSQSTSIRFKSMNIPWKLKKSISVVFNWVKESKSILFLSFASWPGERRILLALFIVFMQKQLM